MRKKSKDVIQNTPWLKLTYRTIGLAMKVHNELGPGHQEAVYHNAMAAKFKAAGINFEDEPYIPVTLEDSTVVGGNSPDLVAEQTAIVELKARSHLMTRDDQARIIGYFAALPQCPWRCTSTLAARVWNIADCSHPKRSKRSNVRSGAS